MQHSGARSGTVIGVVLALACTVGALSPEKSLRRIAFAPQLELQLWATAPQVLDSIAIAWDEFGTAYVAECRDYPDSAI